MDRPTVKVKSANEWNSKDVGCARVSPREDQITPEQREMMRTRFGSQTHHPDRENTTRNFRNADLWFESVESPHGLTGIGDELVGLDVVSESYPGAHFATFGQKLITPLIKSSTSEHGCCAECGAPWRRVVQRERVPTRPGVNTKVNAKTWDKDNMSVIPGRLDGNVIGNRDPLRHCTETQTVGWQPTCTCHGKFVKRKQQKLVVRLETDNGTKTEIAYAPGGNTSLGTFKGRKRVEEYVGEYVEEYVSDLPLEDHPVVPCVVLDPFCGSSTTNCVALSHGRRSIGIDLSADYLKHQAIPRIEGALLRIPHLAHLVGREVKTVEGGAEC